MLKGNDLDRLIILCMEQVHATTRRGRHHDVGQVRRGDVREEVPRRILNLERLLIVSYYASKLERQKWMPGRLYDNNVGEQQYQDDYRQGDSQS